MADRAPIQPSSLIGKPLSDIECDVMGGDLPRNQSGNAMCY